MGQRSLFIGSFEIARKQYFAAAKLLCSGLGLGIHHTIALWFISAVISGEVKLTQANLSFVFPLLAQHWFVVTKYVDQR